MLLQERIIELDSLIINSKGNKIKLTGFMSEDSLLSYYNDNIKCHLSQGVYDKESIDFAYLKDNALCVVQENDIEVTRFKYVVLKKGTLNYKDPLDGKDKSKIYKLRICQYTNKYNLYESTRSLLFDSKEDLINFLMDEYNIDSLNMLE